MKQYRENIKTIQGTHTFEWQKKAIETIKNKNNVILSSPTGTGKTKVFLDWALNKNTDTIYITAPIKALSNQRYKELLEKDYNAKIETGDMKTDFKSDKKPKIVCCTQEIYTNHYLNDKNATLVIDEFHYIFENNDRSRTYIDALSKTKAENIILCSATFGNTEKLNKYIDKISNRSFFLYENSKRVTDIIFKAPIDINNEKELSNIHNALVVSFSMKGCRAISNKISCGRSLLSEKKINKIENLANKFHVKPIPREIYYGITCYTGSMLPKEKLFIEKCFSEKLIDVVCGTDALALGVNFPVESVYFTQLAKYYRGPISKNLFDQLAGRSGRSDFFDKGYVSYISGFNNEAFGYDEELYFNLIKNHNEEPEIKLNPDYKKIINGEITLEEELNYIYNNSLDDNINLTDEKENIYNFYNSYYNSLVIMSLNKALKTQQKVNKNIVLSDFSIENDEFYDIDYNNNNSRDIIKSVLDFYNKENSKFCRYIMTFSLSDIVKKEKFNFNLFCENSEYENNISKDFISKFISDLKYSTMNYYRNIIELGKNIFFNEFSIFYNIELINSIFTNGQNGLNNEFNEITNFNEMLQFSKWYSSIPNIIKEQYNLSKTNPYISLIKEIDELAIDANKMINVLKNNSKILTKNNILDLLKEKTNDIFIIPDEIEIIDSNTFSDMMNLKQIKLPDALKEIRKFAFCNCPNLENIIISDQLDLEHIKTDIDSFINCNIENVNIIIDDDKKYNYSDNIFKFDDLKENILDNIE